MTLQEEIKRQAQDDYRDFCARKGDDLYKECKSQMKYYGFVTLKCHGYCSGEGASVRPSDRAHCCRWGEEQGFVVEGKPGCSNGADIRFFMR